MKFWYDEANNKIPGLLHEIGLGIDVPALEKFATVSETIRKH